MAHEPYYQIHGPTKADVIQAIKKTYFITNLHKSSNSYEENENILTHYSITFESIRLVKGWEEKVNTIINEEVDKSKKLFKKYNWPIIDVTRKSVEETAASILKIFEIKKNK